MFNFLKSKKMQIKFTKDYKIFNDVIGNRNIDRKNRARLKKSIEIYGIQQPILVNENNSIHDGKHRFDIAKELGITVPYVVSSITNEDIIDQLQISKRWSALDYCNKRAEKGCNICITALEISEKWYKETNGKFSIINGLTLLNDGHGNNIGILLQNNSYKINVDDANRIYKALHILKENQNKRFNPFSATNSRTIKRLDAKVGGLDYKKIKKLTQKNYLIGYSNEKDHYNYLYDLYKKYK